MYGEDESNIATATGADSTLPLYFDLATNNKIKNVIGGSKNDTLIAGTADVNLSGGASKDVFSYAKNNSGNVEIQKFDLTNDKLKIAGGTVSNISTVSGGYWLLSNHDE